MARLRGTIAAAILIFAVLVAPAGARSNSAENPLYAEYRQLQALFAVKQWNEVATRAPILLAGMDSANLTASVGYSQVLGWAAFSLMYAGRYTEADPYVQRALAWEQASHGPISDGYFKNLENYAELYLLVNRPDGAEKLYRDCAETSQRIGGPDAVNVASCMIRLGNVLREYGRYSEAVPIYHRVIAIYQKALGADHDWTLTAQAGLSTADLELGRYAEAEAIENRLLAHHEKQRGPNDPTVAIHLHNLANVYERLGRPEESEALERRAVAIQEKQLRPGAAQETYSIYAGYLTSLSTFTTSLGHFTEAEANLTRALAIEEKASGPDQPNAARVAQALGELYHREGKLREAEPLLQRAVAVWQRFQLTHIERTEGEYELALLYRDLGRLSEAEPLLDMAVEGRKGSYGPAHPEYARVLSALGQVKFAAGKKKEGLDLVQQAGAIASASLSKDAGAATPFEARALRPLFDAELAVLRRDATTSGGDHDEEAFEAAQWATQSAAASALGQMASRFAAGTGALAELVREQQDLANQRRGLDRALVAQMSGPDQRGASQDDLRRQLALIDQRLAAINEQFVREFPDYANLSNPGPLTRSAAQALLRPDEALVFLLAGKNGSEAFALTREAAVWRSIPLTEDQLAEKVAAFRRGLDINEFERSLTSAKPVMFDLTGSHELYEALLGPIEATIKGKKNLIVVPSGPLTSLPFQLLAVDPAAPVSRIEDIADYRKVHWLITRHAVSILPSVASLRALRIIGSRSAGSKPLVGFADPVFGKEAVATASRDGTGKSGARNLETGNYTNFWKGAGIDRVRLTEALPRLPDTADELTVVAKAVGADPRDIFLREQASETAVKKLPLADYRIIYFATHGLVAGDIKGLAEPSLALTTPHDLTDLDDGLLTASEIALLRLNADWVVLSACNTAAGDKPGAEALSGLARSFFYAGARALLVSHWAVASDAAANLTVATFNNLASDPTMGRSEALRRAMLAYLNEPSDPSHAYPAFWGPFEIVGEGTAP